MGGLLSLVCFAPDHLVGVDHLTDQPHQGVEAVASTLIGESLRDRRVTPRRRRAGGRGRGTAGRRGGFDAASCTSSRLRRGACGRRFGLVGSAAGTVVDDVCSVTVRRRPRLRRRAGLHHDNLGRDWWRRRRNDEAHNVQEPERGLRAPGPNRRRARGYSRRRRSMSASPSCPALFRWSEQHSQPPSTIFSRRVGDLWRHLLSRRRVSRDASDSPDVRHPSLRRLKRRKPDVPFMCCIVRIISSTTAPASRCLLAPPVHGPTGARFSWDSSEKLLHNVAELVPLWSPFTSALIGVQAGA